MSTLLSIGIENFRSYYRKEVLKFPSIEETKVTALYGPNAGGKSNTIKAFFPAIQCIVHSSEASFTLPYEPFLLREESDKEPTTFAFTYDEAEDIFTYTFSYNQERICHEELRMRPGGTGKEKTIFKRNVEGVLNAGASQYGFTKKLADVTRRDTLLITKARENNNAYSNVIFEMFTSLVFVNAAHSGLDPQYAEVLKRDELIRLKTIEILKKCDFTIRDLAINEVTIPDELIAALPEEVKNAFSKGNQVTTTYVIRDEFLTAVGNRQFDLAAQESAGTNELVGVIVPILVALLNGKTIFIDEFGAFMHSKLLNAIVDLFESGDNETGARLVLTTHNTSLLGRPSINRESIFFVEKNLGEESAITPFSTLSVRKDEAFERRYRDGLYGAVPIIRMSEV